MFIRHIDVLAERWCQARGVRAGVVRAELPRQAVRVSGGYQYRRRVWVFTVGKRVVREVEKRGGPLVLVQCRSFDPVGDQIDVLRVFSVPEGAVREMRCEVQSERGWHWFLSQFQVWP